MRSLSDMKGGNDEALIRERTSTDGDLQRYCQRCRTLRPVTIEEAGDSNYYNQDVSVVTCAHCGYQLGHLTWWPDDD